MVRLLFGYSHKLTALVLVLAIIPTLVISSYMYSDKITRETNTIQEQLKSMSQVGAITTQDQLEVRKNVIRDIASNQLVIAETKKINYSTDINELFRSQFALARQFSVILHQNNDWLKQLIISDPETGDVLFHTDLHFSEGNLRNEKHFQDAVNGKIGVSEVYRSLAPIKNEYEIYEQGTPTLLVSAPITGEVGVEGVLTARLDAFKIIPESNYRESPFIKLDIYAVNSDGYFLSKPLFLNDILELNLIKKRPELTLQAIDPQSNGLGRNFPLAEMVLNVDGYENYLGNTVIGSIASIGGTSWYYVVEVDKNEAYESVVLTRNSLLMYTSIALIIIIVVSVLFARSLVNPIKKLTKVTEIISSGDLEVVMDPKLSGLRDEIGTLATGFDCMRQNIKKANNELLARHTDALLNEQMLRLEYKKGKELANRLEKLNYELQNEKLKFEELYDGSPDLYRTIDKDGIILNCNRSYANSLGYSKDEVIGRSIFEHVSEDSIEALRSSFETWRRYGKVLNREVIMKRKDGTTFPALVSATNLYDNNGNLIGSNTIIKDMSEIQHYKNLMEELRNLDRAKEEFSSMVAHELKTPLVPILLYAELLLDEKLGNLTPKQKEKLKIMHDSAKSLAELVQDVLDVHKLELGKVRFEIHETSSKELIDACINRFKLLAQEKNVKLISNVDSQSILIQCDRERILQVLNNLVNNALRFVAENDGKVEVSAAKHNGSVIFSVKDNGIGIQKDKQQNLFKKFYQVDMSNTRKSSGSGLGLAICKGIVDAHEGRIWCRSEEGKGSAFYFSIPVRASNKVIENCQA